MPENGQLWGQRETQAQRNNKELLGAIARSNPHIMLALAEVPLSRPKWNFPLQAELLAVEFRCLAPQLNFLALPFDCLALQFDPLALQSDCLAHQFDLLVLLFDFWHSHWIVWHPHRLYGTPT